MKTFTQTLAIAAAIATVAGMSFAPTAAQAGRGGKRPYHIGERWSSPEIPGEEENHPYNRHDCQRARAGAR